MPPIEGAFGEEIRPAHCRVPARTRPPELSPGEFLKREAFCGLFESLLGNKNATLLGGIFIGGEEEIRTLETR